MRVAVQNILDRRIWGVINVFNKRQCEVIGWNPDFVPTLDLLDNNKPDILIYDGDPNITKCIDLVKDEYPLLHSVKIQNFKKDLYANELDPILDQSFECDILMMPLMGDDLYAQQRKSEQIEKERLKTITLLSKNFVDFSVRVIGRPIGNNSNYVGTIQNMEERIKALSSCGIYIDVNDGNFLDAAILETPCLACSTPFLMPTLENIKKLSDDDFRKEYVKKTKEYAKKITYEKLADEILEGKKWKTA